MKNSHMPANPIHKDDLSDFTGLTKREAFAMAAMQGLCASKYYITEDWKEIIAKESVIIADALLSKLDN